MPKYVTMYHHNMYTHDSILEHIRCYVCIFCNTGKYIYVQNF